MAWSTPMTAVANTGLTAAQWNASVRDNLLETAPAKATTAGRWIVTTGANAVAEREIKQSEVLTQQTTTSTSYANLATVGPTVTITTGLQVIASVSAQMSNSGTSTVWSSYGISGATTTAISDNQAIQFQATAGDAAKMTCTSLLAVNTGSNVFLQQYRVGASGTGTFDDRRMLVMSL